MALCILRPNGWEFGVQLARASDKSRFSAEGRKKPGHIYQRMLISLLIIVSACQNVVRGYVLDKDIITLDVEERVLESTGIR